MRRRLDSLDRRIIGLAVPALGTLAVEPLYNLTDTAIVGHLGRAPLGGLALAASILNVVGWGSGFLSMATTSRIAFRRGQRDDSAVAAAAVSAYWVALVLGVVLAGVLAGVAEPLCRLLGGQGAVLDNAVTYLRVAAAGVPFLLVTLAGNGHLRGLENTRTPFHITVAANVVNVALELVLVYGLGLGVAGSALGTVVAQVLSAVAFVTVAAAPAARRRLLPDREDVRDLLRAGAVLFVRTAALVTALTVSTAIAARLTPGALGGHQIALQFWLLLALTLDALAVPAQVYVGNALGAGDVAQARQLGARCLQLGWVLGLACLALTAVLAPVLPKAFSSDPSVQHAATVALLVCAVQQPLAAAAFVLDGLLLGAGDYAALRRFMVLALVPFAPLAALTMAFPGLGIAGVWGALGCWLAGRAALLGGRWHRGTWAPVTR